MGAGVTLYWDSRIPYRDPWRDEHGRMVAVTLCGPSKVGTRVVLVYGYANPSKWGVRPRILLRQINEQRVWAASRSLGFILMGDLNDSPVEVNSKFRRPNSGYTSRCPSIPASLPYPIQPDRNEIQLAPRLHDAFRRRHPTVNGFTRWFHAGDTPSRLIQIWTTRKLAPRGATVDTGRALMPPSCQGDHFTLGVWTSFHLALGSRAARARAAPRVSSSSVLSVEKLESNQAERTKWAGGLATDARIQSLIGSMPEGGFATIESTSTALDTLNTVLTESLAPYQPVSKASPRKAGPSTIPDGHAALLESALAFRASCEDALDISAFAGMAIITSKALQ